jgi:uncharacterized membrane protein YeaQ/YmgE (transglycosylase-associated protein family)
MPFESLLILLLIGAAAGYLASMLVRGYGFGTIGNIAVGITGAFVAGWLLPQLGLFTGSAIGGQIVSATVGAVMLLILIQFVRRVA